MKEFNGLQASLQACKEPLAQARKKLLRHGNLALDAEQRAQLELRRLTLTLALTLALTLPLTRDGKDAQHCTMGVISRDGWAVVDELRVNPNPNPNQLR